MRFRFNTFLFFLVCAVGVSSGARIKDIVEIQGVRGNPLMGTWARVLLWGLMPPEIPRFRAGRCCQVCCSGREV